MSPHLKTTTTRKRWAGHTQLQPCRKKYVSMFHHSLTQHHSVLERDCILHILFHSLLHRHVMKVQKDFTHQMFLSAGFYTRQTGLTKPFSLVKQTRLTVLCRILCRPVLNVKTDWTHQTIFSCKTD